ncbi:MAG: hypothetical protein ABSD69_00970 [Candidatus Levyibacteriota bacterium]
MDDNTTGQQPINPTAPVQTPAEPSGMPQAPVEPPVQTPAEPSGMPQAPVEPPVQTPAQTPVPGVPPDPVV